MAVTFGAGVVLIVLDYFLSRKKKGGFTFTDRQRLIGIFWLTIFITALVGSLVWVADKIG
jgi:hypothetical protein